jgi:uncharacterized protein YjcR
MLSTVSQECQIATIADQYECIDNACLKFNCKSGTVKSWCKTNWEEMDCIRALIQKKCSAADLASVVAGLKKKQLESEAGKCKQYPRH